jgi:endonuclease G
MDVREPQSRPVGPTRPEQERQTAAATARVHDRSEQRRRQIEVLRDPAAGPAQADSPQRVATRIDRLSRYVAGELPPPVGKASSATDPDALIAEAVRRAAPVLGEAGRAALDAPTAAGAAGRVLEAIVNTVDFVGVRYLEAGVLAARAVGRVDVRDAAGDVIAFGTGSMVSPRLLLTNHHVLVDAGAAAASQIEFNFQLGLDGRRLPSVFFDLTPATFFLTDADLDYTLVAVGRDEDAAAVAAFGHNPLIAAEGKAIVGDFVTIVQHPEGREKQVALRENRVVDVLEDFLHYATDTQPGSSGSPVFNDQWEVVALHHASVPDPDQVALGGVVNEGVRVSRILAHANAQNLRGEQHALLAEVQSSPPLLAPQTGNGGAAAPVGDQERVSIDPDYADRRGYDPDFLGMGPLRVPLPVLPPDLLARAVRMTGDSGPDAHVLPYHHFSVVLDAERRLARFTAVNIDGARYRDLPRENDRWFYDPRIPRDRQTGEDVYAHNDLDRGHLVRRRDPAWGDDEATARRANDDTFHFTNCSPQHKRFNQSQTLWAGLEEYLLRNADRLNFRASVFTGPVLAPDDDRYRGVQLPRQFWKVAVMAKRDGRRSATAYLLSQEALIRGLEQAPAAFDYGAYRTFQVPVARVEELTGLDFGELAADDPLAQLESTRDAARALDGPDDIVV